MILGKVIDISCKEFPHYLKIEVGDMLTVMNGRTYTINDIKNGHLATCERIFKENEGLGVINRSMIIDLKKDFYYIRLLILDHLKDIENSKYKKINYNTFYNNNDEVLNLENNTIVLCNFSYKPYLYTIQIPKTEDKLDYLIRK